MKTKTIILTLLSLSFLTLCGFDQINTKEIDMSKLTPAQAHQERVAKAAEKKEKAVTAKKVEEKKEAITKVLIVGKQAVIPNSPALKHQGKVAEIIAQKNVEVALQTQDEETIQALSKEMEKFNLVYTNLQNEYERARKLPKGPERLALIKDEILPVFTPIVDAYLEGEEFHKNPILVECMIWLFDTGQIDKACTYAKAALEQKQGMPERFSRDLKTFVADAVLVWADGEVKAERSPAPYFEETFSKVIAEEGKTPELLVHEDIRLKYLKLQAKRKEQEGEIKVALGLYTQAQNLNPLKAKVTTVLTRLNKKLDKQKA